MLPTPVEQKCDDPELLTVTATVIASTSDGCYLEVPVSTSCSGCSQQQQCSSGLLAKALPTRRQQLWLYCEAPPQVGEQVLISIQPKAVLYSALLVYLLPIVVFMAVLLLADSNQWPEAVQLISAVGSAAITLWFVRQLEGRRADQLEIKLLQVLPTLSVNQLPS